MFLQIYLGFLAAMLTASAINVILIKYSQYKALKRQQELNSIAQQHQQNLGITLKQPVVH